jgi:hypothetical protein
MTHPTTDIRTEREKEFLDWMDEQDGYYLNRDEVEKKFPEIEFNMTGVTSKLGDDGEWLTPKRDFRQSIVYGQALD